MDTWDHGIKVCLYDYWLYDCYAVYWQTLEFRIDITRSFVCSDLYQLYTPLAALQLFMLDTSWELALPWKVGNNPVENCQIAKTALSTISLMGKHQLFVAASFDHGFSVPWFSPTSSSTRIECFDRWPSPTLSPNTWMIHLPEFHFLLTQNIPFSSYIRLVSSSKPTTKISKQQI